MKMIFVDAENIGLKALEAVEATVIDKVFVFSKVESVQRACEKSLFLFLSDYPSGSNQADFYIIAYLSRVLLALDKKQYGTVSFELYSNDENLISAFEFQCAQLGARAHSIRTKNETVVALPKTTLAKPSPAERKNPSKPRSNADKLLTALRLPTPLSPSLQKKLGLTKGEFTTLTNEMIKAKKIKRSPESKKKWVCC
ncbi:MAG: hypothetical protein ACPGMR_10580 [Pontibacterium sp.]